ncbi:MAG TPA: DUF3291 domain-containing protein, partial [Candidatus Limnocylindria bacterium]|nr:DUF3291 domain-containing protein [Candidatus Limnocylindria bacterium]
AQLNLARLSAPLDSPQLADFVASLEPVNALADAAPGFVWRLKDDSGNATALRPWGEDTIVNLSVWDSVESLRAFVFGADHSAVLRRRRQWFGPYGTPSLVLWWVPSGHRPTMEEARERLDLLTATGPGADAFTLREAHGPPV